MVKRLAAVGAAVAVVFVLAGCEPSMTITAHAPAKQACRTVIHVDGTVSPATATPKVVLQHTVGGKWSDVQGWGSQSQYDSTAKATARTGVVSQSTGAYRINDYYTPGLGVGEFTMHLRVRSNGGGSVSPSFYVSADISEGC